MSGRGIVKMVGWKERVGAVEPKQTSLRPMESIGRIRTRLDSVKLSKASAELIVWLLAPPYPPNNKKEITPIMEMRT